MLNQLANRSKTALTLLSLSVAVFVASCKKDEQPQPQPTLTSISITEGEVGTALTLTGTNFGASASDAKVLFGTIEAAVSSITSTQIVTTVPASIPGEVDVKVKVKALQTTSKKFKVLDPITVSATHFTTTVQENPAVNAVLGTVQASTNRGTLTYSISSQSVQGALAINSANGQLTVAKASAFDYEAQTTHSITATVSVANSLETATANVTITLTDIAEVSISNQTFTIAENPSNYAIIGAVTNSSWSGTPQFAIVSVTPANSVSINNTDGQFAVANPAAFDFETNPTISGTFKVTSQSEIKTASFTITVTDVAEVNVQALLDAGQTPKQIYDNDHTLLNQLYGKLYGGGVIASFDASTGTGLILSSYLPNGTVTVQQGYTFADAVAVANSSTLNGYTDWRLPTRAEAEAMCYSAAPNSLPFLGGGMCWTSSVYGTSGHVNGNSAFSFAIIDNGCSEGSFAMGTLGALRAVREYGRAAEQFMTTSSSVLAGSGSGCVNGITGSTTSFTSPYFGYVSGSSIYISDKYCGARKLDLTSGVVSAASTLFQNGSSAWEYTDFEYSNDGNYLLMVYREVAGGGGNVLRAVATNTNSRINSSSSTLFLPSAIAHDASGNIYVTEQRTIKKFSIDANGAGTLLATYGNAADARSTDGPVASATFTQTVDVQVDANGNIYVADINSVRKINPTAGTVTTVASGFNGINGIGLTPNGSIIVADGGNSKIRLINSSGQVYTLLDGLSTAPQGIIVQNDATFYYTASNTIFKAIIN